MSHALGEIWRACPIPGNSLPASCQTHFFLLPLQAPGETETQHLWGQGGPPDGPILTLALVRRAYGSSWVGSCSFMESFPSGHNAWEKVSNVLFVWDIWFCKKLKKNKKPKDQKLGASCACVFRERLAQASTYAFSCPVAIAEACSG